MVSDDDTLVSLKEAARLVGVQPRRLGALIDKLAIPHTLRISGSKRFIRIKPSDLDNAIAYINKEKKRQRRKSKTITSCVNQRKSEDTFTPREPSPTGYPPGTRGKIQEMAARVKRGEDVWHDRDSASMGVVRRDADGVDMLALTTEADDLD